mmetsp:Transcript_6319/g.13776  ORF Transcript_6319/g.13776 Transcript_6319/m.13776 type:complete len:411 (-) Transcript_6319:68-1300(-)
MPSLEMQTLSPPPFIGDENCENDVGGEEFFCPCSIGESFASPVMSQDTINRVADQFDIMRHQESSTYRIYDYLATIAPSTASPAQGAHNPIDESCRGKMIAWCYQVIDYCTFQRSTVETAINILDRFLCNTAHPIAQKCTYSRKTYQLAAMTSLYTAIKINEPAVFDPKIVSSLGRGCVTEDQVVEMERHILEGVHWRVAPPTSSSLVHSLVDLLPATSAKASVHAQIKTNLLSFALYHTELAVGDYELAPVRTSTIALCAVLNATQIMDNVLSRDVIKNFLEHIQIATGVDLYSSAGVDQVMDRLMKLAGDGAFEGNTTAENESSDSLRSLSTCNSNISAMSTDSIATPSTNSPYQSTTDQQEVNGQKSRAPRRVSLSLSPTCVMRGADKQEMRAVAANSQRAARYLAQ